MKHFLLFFCVVTLSSSLIASQTANQHCMAIIANCSSTPCTITYLRYNPELEGLYKKTENISPGKQIKINAFRGQKEFASSTITVEHPDGPVEVKTKLFHNDRIRICSNAINLLTQKAFNEKNKRKLSD